MSNENNSLTDLESLSTELQEMKRDLLQYKEYILEDGVIDADEQEVLDSMLEAIQRATEKLSELQTTYAGESCEVAPINGGGEELEEQETPMSTGCDPAKIQEITERYNAMIADARSLGKNVAANNLQRFIDGRGGTRQIDVTWLRGFSDVEDAESRILGYTESEGNNCLEQWAPAIAEGASESRTDYWIGDIRAYNITSELAYASGASKIRGEVALDFTRSNDIVTISGTVTMNWWDDYNWNKGMSFYIPGSGTISDDDGLYLKRCAGARDFRMEAQWVFNYSGTYDAGTSRWTKNEWTIDGQTYEPSEGDIDTDSR